MAQFFAGLSSAASLFLLASGLTLVFGVSRIVNFAHGSLFMLGAYLAWSILSRTARDPASFAAGILAASLCVALLGAALEMGLLRRLYGQPELFQLLATYGVVLIVQDAAQRIWGPADLTIGRPPWLRSAIGFGGNRFPVFDLVRIGAGLTVFGGLLALLHRTRFGVLIRAATENRAMAAALGIDQTRLFTLVFALGAGLAGLGGALALPDRSANLQMDVPAATDAFVVVAIGGLGSVTGAFLASLLIGLLQAFGVALLPRATLVLTFAAMAAVLALRPHGLLGRPLQDTPLISAAPIRPAAPWQRVLAALAFAAAAAVPFVAGDYVLAVLTEAAAFSLLAASLHLAMGPGGMPSFGHAAWFGLGAYGAGLAVHLLAAPVPVALLAGTLVAGLAAFAVGLVAARLSGVYLAMLSLAFAQIVWAAASQWNSVTGGDDGILGLWPGLSPAGIYWMTLVVCAAGIVLLRVAIFSPAGGALRAARDSPVRAESIGVPTRRVRLAAFAAAGVAAGLAGGLYTFAKGSVFPGYAAIGTSVDALVMVLLGGVQTVSGPVLGAIAYTGAYDLLIRATDLWRAALGTLILSLVLLRPAGLGARP